MKTIFISAPSDQRLHVVSARTGKLVWTYWTEGQIHSSPRIAEGHVFIGSDDHELHAVNVNTSRASGSSMPPIECGPRHLSPTNWFILAQKAAISYAVDFRGTMKWRFQAKTRNHVLANRRRAIRVLCLHGRHAVLPGRPQWLGHLAFPAGERLRLVTGPGRRLCFCRRGRWIHLLR